MAATQVTFKATADGKPLEVLQDLVKRRVESMRETTRDAVVATAQNILTSIRAATRKADPKKAKFAFTIAERNDLVAGYKRRKRVIRQRGGHEVYGINVINAAGAYQPKEIVKVYIAIVRYGKFSTEVGKQAGRYFIIAKEQSDAAAAVENRIKNRIKKFSGMAKWVISMAQWQVSSQMNSGGASGIEKVKSIAQRVGRDNLVVRCAGGGFNSGFASVHVLDDLKYAAPALRGGNAALNTIYMKAANKTVSVINHWKANSLWNLFNPSEKIPTPFTEVRSRK